MTKNERIVRQCAAIFRLSARLVRLLRILKDALLCAAFIGFAGLALEEFGFVHQLGAIGLLVILFSGCLFLTISLCTIVSVLIIARADGDEETKYDELIALARKHNEENGK